MLWGQGFITDFTLLQWSHRKLAATGKGLEAYKTLLGSNKIRDCHVLGFKGQQWSWSVKNGQLVGIRDTSTGFGINAKTSDFRTASSAGTGHHLPLTPQPFHKWVRFVLPCQMALRTAMLPNSLKKKKKNTSPTHPSLSEGSVTSGELAPPASFTTRRPAQKTISQLASDTRF